MDWLLQHWWLIFVFGGSASAAVKGVGAWNDRRAERRLERFRIKQEAEVALANAQGMGRVNRDVARRELTQAVTEHDGVDARWLGYETDLATVLDYPMMIDLREPLTVEFHKARRRAELTRPEPVEALLDDADGLRDYRQAVHDYAAAFDVAEQEARRRRRGDFSPDEQQRLSRAQHLLNLALDEGATPHERQQAYRRAQQELDGLVVLPGPGAMALERQVRAALESAPGT